MIEIILLIVDKRSDRKYCRITYTVSRKTNIEAFLTVYDYKDNIRVREN